MAIIITKVEMEKSDMAILKTNKSKYGLTVTWQLMRAVKLFTMFTPEEVEKMIKEKV